MTTPGSYVADPDTARPSTVDRTGSSRWPLAVVAVVAAAAATTAVAAFARGIDVPVAVEDEPIPLAGFATMTVLWSVVGIVMAAGMARWARHPRSLFIITTVILTALSCIPSLTADADTATRVVLTSTHLVAAAIVIPALSRLLPGERPS